MQNKQRQTQTSIISTQTYNYHIVKLKQKTPFINLISLYWSIQTDLILFDHSHITILTNPYRKKPLSLITYHYIDKSRQIRSLVITHISPYWQTQTWKTLFYCLHINIMINKHIIREDPSLTYQPNDHLLVCSPYIMLISHLCGTWHCANSHV